MDKSSAILFVLISSCWLIPPTFAQTAQCKHVYDSTLYSDKPDSLPNWFQPLTVIYETDFFNRIEWDNCQDKRIGCALLPASETKSGIVVLDVEKWDFNHHVKNQESIIDTLAVILDESKAASPTKRFGYYGMPPIVNFWGPVGGRFSLKHYLWISNNNKLSKIAESSDILFPSVYTFYPDIEQWKRFAKNQISEAKRLAKGKEVVAFIWPEYHDSSDPKYAGKYIGDTFWRAQIETLLKEGASITVWGGYKQSWDPNSSWFRVLSEFSNGFCYGE